MNKLYIVALLLVCAATVQAKSLKKRVSDLEDKVALLGRNEEESWKELKRMDKDVSRLENKELSRAQNTEAMMTASEAGEEL